MRGTLQTSRSAGTLPCPSRGLSFLFHSIPPSSRCARRCPSRRAARGAPRPRSPGAGRGATRHERSAWARRRKGLCEEEVGPGSPGPTGAHSNSWREPGAPAPWGEPARVLARDEGTRTGVGSRVSESSDGPRGRGGGPGRGRGRGTPAVTGSQSKGTEARAARPTVGSESCGQGRPGPGRDHSPRRQPET